MGEANRDVKVLVASNLLSGVGIASGVAVGALLVEDLGGTAIAGLGSSVTILGAGIAAVPLARLAVRHGRRRSLATGYAIAVLGAVLILTATALQQLLLLIVALGFFGVAQAVNLQSRYAAADDVPAASRARAMSVVVWATTIGSVAGPNLSGLGEGLGGSLGITPLAGPYLFSVVAFGAAGLVVALRFGAGPGQPGRGPVVPAAAGPSSLRAGGSLAALRWAAGDRRGGFAVVLIAVAHSVMVMVMVMTPLHMHHGGMTIELVGAVISLHIVGMYLLSPVFGWAADRFGAERISVLGMLTLVVALGLGVLAATVGGGVLTACALTVLGVGWSACIISASALLAAVPDVDVRVPLQGVTDAGMNYAAAALSALAGPILALGGFAALNVMAAALLVPALLLLPRALRARAADTAEV